MSKGWHIARDEDSLTLSRHPAPRFDVQAETEFPLLRMLPLAQMIRQDMWRRLQRIRGFAPAVQVHHTDTGLRVVAGGTIDGRFPRARTEARLTTLLHDPVYRARWERCARLTSRKCVL